MADGDATQSPGPHGTRSQLVDANGSQLFDTNGSPLYHDEPPISGASVGETGVDEKAEVIGDLELELVVAQISRDPRVFEHAARFAARTIERELNALAEKIPNEPDALDGYKNIRTALERLQAGFEDLAGAVQNASAVTDPVEQTSLLRGVVLAARALSEGFVEWFIENGNHSGRVLARLGLAGVISGTLGYFVGVPPLMSFPVAVAAIERESIWEAIKLFAPGNKK